MRWNVSLCIEKNDARAYEVVGFQNTLKHHKLLLQSSILNGGKFISFISSQSLPILIFFSATPFYFVYSKTKETHINSLVAIYSKKWKWTILSIATSLIRNRAWGSLPNQLLINLIAFLILLLFYSPLFSSTLPIWDSFSLSSDCTCRIHHLIMFNGFTSDHGYVNYKLIKGLVYIF